MANEIRNPENDKITLEIARLLASEGKYSNAFQLLYPLLHSQYVIEVSILIAKIYAQTQDFKTAEKYYLHALNMDSHNPEALFGLKKCRELKNSQFKAFLSFNRLNILFIAFIILVGALIGVILNALF